LNIFLEAGIQPQMVVEMFGKMAPGTTDPRHLIINILSLCIFPIAARPMMQRLLFNCDDRAYNQFLLERKKTVSDFVKNVIQS
jgi:hypothetical protein